MGGGGGAQEIIAEPMHLYGSGRFVGGAGHQKVLQNLCICMVLEGWLKGRGTRNHCKINAFVGFGRLVGRAGHHKSLQEQGIYIIWEGWLGGWGTRIVVFNNAFVLFWKVDWGAGQQNHCKTNAVVLFWKVDRGEVH